LNDWIGKTPIINLLCIFLVIGIFCGDHIALQLGIAVGIFLLCIILAFAFRSDRLVFTICVCMAALLVGMMLIWNKTNSDQRKSLVNLHDEEVVLVGKIYQDPDRREGVAYYRVRVEKVYFEDNWYEAGTRIMLRAERYPEYEYGDVLQIAGKLEEPPEDEDFSYKQYLIRQGIYSWMQRSEQVDRIGQNQGSVFLASIFRIKHTLESQINELWPEPESSLLAGLLLGVRRGFSEEFQDALKRTGTTHIIAISGYNISIIVLLLQRLMSQTIPRKKQLPIFTIGIILFTILVGASASVVRAALMGWLVLLAAYLGRLSRVTTSLLLASSLMIILNPFTLWDLGFQLSFLATAGIIWIYPLVGQSSWYKKVLEDRKPKSNDQDNGLNDQAKASKGRLFRLSQKVYSGSWVYVWETLMVTLAAQVLVLPIILYNFGEISLISPLVNLFVLFPIPAAMLFGFLAALLGFISPLLALPISFVAWVILHYIVEVIRFASGFPIALITFSHFPIQLVVAWFLLVAALAWYIKRQTKNKNSKKDREEYE